MQRLCRILHVFLPDKGYPGLLFYRVAKIRISTCSFLAASAILVATGASANAATVTYVDTLPTPVSKPVPIATSGTVNQNLTNSVSGRYTSPWEGTEYYGVGSYTSVQGGASATHAHAGPLTFLWSTPDSYNTLSFYLGAELVDSITGASIVARSFLQNGSAFVTIASALLFDTVVFSSADNAFEYSFDVAPAPVPLAAAGILLLGGLGGLAALKSRRKA